ncbi:MAG: hypothetical protein IPP51_12195 [Bacteroidetes bacterium]|nr:hypothetical protein [Bacteroidota bacterium]
MESTIPALYLIIGSVLSLVVGYVVASTMSKRAAQAKEQVAGDKAKIIIKEAESS